MEKNKYLSIAFGDLESNYISGQFHDVALKSAPLAVFVMLSMCCSPFEQSSSHTNAEINQTAKRAILIHYLRNINAISA